MPGLFRDHVILVSAPIAVTFAVLVIGAALTPAPTQVTTAHWLSAFACHDAPVVAVGQSGVGGAAVICVTGDGVRPSIRAKSLTPGTVYRIWYLDLDRALDCSAGECVGDDPSSFDRAGSVGWLSAERAGPDGEVSFVGPLLNLSPHTAQITLLIAAHVPAPQVADLSLVATGPVVTGEVGTVVGRATFRLP